VPDEEPELPEQTARKSAIPSDVRTFLRMVRSSRVVEQAKAPQPHILLVLVLYLIPVILLRWCTLVLMHIPSFARVCAAHPQSYSAVYFSLQMAISLSLVIYFGRRYSTALHSAGARVGKRQLRFAALVFLPLIAWYLFELPRFFMGLDWLMQLPRGPEWTAAIADVHEQVWGRLSYDPSLTGVIFTSVLSLVFPALEEIVFTGFLGNFIARRAGLAAALLVTPCVFAVAHIPGFGFGRHLIGLLCAGACFMLIRVLTGSVRYSIAAHVLLNVVIFVPKWIVAAVYFSAGGG